MDLEFWNRLEPKAHWERNASCGSATLLSCASCGYDRLPGSYPAAQRLERHRLNINMSSMSHRCHRWVWKWCNMATPQFWQFHLGMGFGVAFFQTHQWITDNHSMSRMAYVTSSPYTACYNEELAALDLHGVIPTDGSLRRCQNRDDRDDADDAPDPFRPLCRPLSMSSVPSSRSCCTKVSKLLGFLLMTSSNSGTDNGFKDLRVAALRNVSNPKSWNDFYIFTSTYLYIHLLSPSPKFCCIDPVFFVSVNRFTLPCPWLY